ncbi:ribonucleotide-diphosphate reductase subunit alpha, partial [Butyricicoccus sp. 1XD8-22]
NQMMHSVGLGAMNLHGHLVSQGILYGSKESIDFTDCFMEAMNYYSLKSSMEIAKERGETFYRFEDSDYASGVYFDSYVNKEEKELSPIVLKALGNIPIITTAMWKDLKKEVMQYGLFNA